MTTGTQSDDLKKIREMVKDIDFCMLTTIDEEGNPHRRPMSLNREVDFDRDLWFFTYASTHKVDEVAKRPKVNASFADSDDQRYVSMTGTAEVVRDRKKMEELWQPQLRAWSPKGVDEPDIALLRIKVERAEYWDSPSSMISHAVSLVSAYLNKMKLQGVLKTRRDAQMIYYSIADRERMKVLARAFGDLRCAMQL